MRMMIILLQLVLVMMAAASPSTSSSDTVMCLPDERDALLSFKSAFSIHKVVDCPNGAMTKSWEKDGNCCEWFGVTCDPQTSHVVELHLSSSCLSGSIPSNTTLFRLPNLQSLDLSGNYLSGSIPSNTTLFRLPNLQRLDLSYNNLGGSIPSNTTLFRLPNLQRLDLSSNRLSGSIPSNTTLFRLPNLQSLDLSWNYLSGQVPQEIGWLSHLTSLDLSFNNQLTMPNFQTIISNLTNLIQLSLSHVNIATHLPPIIYNLSNLASLELVRCNLIDDFPSANVDTSVLARVTDIELSGNMLTGVIPGWLFTLPSLSSLGLSYNLFTGISKFEIGNASSLTWFIADSNHLQENIPNSIFKLHNLKALHLQQNNLTGTIPFSRFRKLQHLFDLDLSDNSLTIIDDMDIANSKPSWPDLLFLSLRSCNLGHFPGFIREFRNLQILHLSSNGIPGLVPNWLSELGALNYLNLSHNSLQGGLENFPWQGMLETVDIQYNMFHGIVPIPPPTTQYFWASNNQFTGEVPSSLCNVSGLVLLDLAHNNLTGSIPECIASLIKSGLVVLDLRKNQLHGAIPSSLFQECPKLVDLSLSDNKLECQIPKSISSCKQLELLDLSSNNLNDKFPYWLGTLPFLKIMILASNKLHGSLTAPNTTISFPVLQILDISNNAFTSTLPVELLMSMKAMATVDNTLFLSYMRIPGLYQDSIVTWIKGAARRLDAIYDKFVLIDASRNKLEGLIPDAIGDLVSLRGLNLAHNSFTGRIPPSLSNLTLLESLDLSFNRLIGGIPTELVSLNYLEYFNVSDNNLVGAVPTTKQFGTFSDPSYLGNPGLCGPWLTNKCGKLSDAPQNSAASEGSGDVSSSLQVWEIGLIGCGCGLLGGLAWGYIIFWMNSPYWVQRLIFQIETIAIGYQWRKRNNSTRRIKKRDRQGR